MEVFSRRNKQCLTLKLNLILIYSKKTVDWKIFLYQEKSHFFFWFYQEIVRNNSNIFCKLKKIYKNLQLNRQIEEKKWRKKIKDKFTDVLQHAAGS